MEQLRIMLLEMQARLRNLRDSIQVDNRQTMDELCAEAQALNLRTLNQLEDQQ